MPAWARLAPICLSRRATSQGDRDSRLANGSGLAQEPVLPISGLILARPQVEKLYYRWRPTARVDRNAATLALNRALAAHAVESDVRIN